MCARAVSRRRVKDRVVRFSKGVASSLVFRKTRRARKARTRRGTSRAGAPFCGNCRPIGAFRSSSAAVPPPPVDRASSRTFMMVAPSFEMVVTPLSSCTSLSKPRGPCAIGRAWSAEIRNHEGGLLETTGGSANGEPTRGRTRVVRTESTTAMHALMLEISWPLPWLVSVPSRRSTIWGCCEEGEGASASEGTDRSDGKHKRSGSSRSGAGWNAERDRAVPRHDAPRGETGGRR